MRTIQSNAISIPKIEFDETFATIEALLAHEASPGDFVLNDPFLSKTPIKVDLRKHLQNLFNRMAEVKKNHSPFAEMVTIEFN